jgi:hypothetical protein
VRDALDRARARAAAMDERWRADREEDERVGSAFLQSVVPSLVSATLDRIDLTELAISRVDVERVVEAVDLDRVAARIDLQAIVDRLDLQRITDRIDVEAIVRRLDLAAIATEVIDEIDLPRIVRESTGSMATETVEGIRAQGMSADRAVSRLVDRLLRREEREVPEGGV